MNANGKFAKCRLFYITELSSFDIDHKFASLSHFGNNFIIKLKNLYCISMTYEDIVHFGGDCQVRAYHGQTLLRHCRRRGHRGRNQRVHRHEQRGAGCEKYLSPPKLVGKDKKGSDK